MQHSLDVLRMLIPRPVGQDAEGREGSMVCHLWLNDASLYHQYIIIPLSLYHYIIIYIRLSYSMTGVSPWYLLGISLEAAFEISSWRAASWPWLFCMEDDRFPCPSHRDSETKFIEGPWQPWI